MPQCSPHELFESKFPANKKGSAAAAAATAYISMKWKHLTTKQSSNFCLLKIAMFS